MSNAFITFIETIMIFILYSVNVMYHIKLFTYIEPLLHPSDQFHLVMVDDPFNVLLDSWATLA